MKNDEVEMAGNCPGSFAHLYELTQPLLQERTVASLGRLRIRFSTVTWILFLVFLGMVYTKVVMILSS